MLHGPPTRQQLRRFDLYCFDHSDMKFQRFIFIFVILLFKETLLRSFTDKAPSQLRRFASDCFTSLKRKFKACSVSRNPIAPMMLNPEGTDMLFPNEASIELFVNCFMECVSLLLLKVLSRKLKSYFSFMVGCCSATS